MLKMRVYMETVGITETGRQCRNSLLRNQELRMEKDVIVKISSSKLITEYTSVTQN